MVLENQPCDYQSPMGNKKVHMCGLDWKYAIAPNFQVKISQYSNLDGENEI